MQAEQTVHAPAVSVCIPTYCGGEALEAAIASVLAQGFADFELIVIDDGSPDDTAQRVARFADPRLRYLRNARNLGPQGNWNRCLSEARGRYFKLLPHDDLLAPDCLAQQLAVLEADPSLAFSFCAREVIGPTGKALMRRGFGRHGDGRVAAAALKQACVRKGTNVIGEPGAVLMRRELALRIGSFDAAQPYVIDLDYWFRLLAHGDAYYLSQALASFRVSRSQWSVVIGRAQATDFRDFLRRMEAQGHLRLGALDRLRGALMASLNNTARLLFYRVLL